MYFVKYVSPVRNDLFPVAFKNKKTNIMLLTNKKLQILNINYFVSNHILLYDIIYYVTVI